MKMAESFLNWKKTLWGKEKLHILSSVFKRLVLQTRKNQGLFGKALRYRDNSMMNATLSFPGNPYPPVIPKQHNKDGFIVNVLIRSAKERRTKNSTEDSESSETSQAFIGLNESDESDLPQVNLKERNEDKGAENSEVVTSNEGMGKSQEINSEKS